VLWIGTGGGGINKFDRQTRIFNHYTTADGLANNFVYRILEDNRGNLWLSTNKGISRFSPSTGMFKNYGLRAGLQGYNFNFGAFYKSQKGEMFFGGVCGINAFYPDRIEDNRHVPPIVITGFELFNRSLDTGDHLPLPKHITQTKEIILSHKHNIFSLEFAALDYSNPGKNQYKYMMEGLHDHWIYLGHQCDITFSGLAPGEYVFRVTGSNNDGVWNEQGTSLKIIIKPPFWQTWWFRALVLLLVGLLLFTWHQSRMKRLSLQLKTEKEMNRLFTKYQISNREQEIIHLILKGKSNKEIEDTLFISIPTVKFHIYSIYRKVKVKNRLELIRFILESVKINYQTVSGPHQEE
jgi:DNA-binding CsgD family transcriptional regulator